jgi:hypothetical protein
MAQAFLLQTGQRCAHVPYLFGCGFIRDSRYFGSCLRSKNATGWLHGEREPTSIGQARRRLVHPFAKHRQVSIEHAVVERSDLNLNVCGVLRNRAGELKKRQQTSPGSLGIGCGKVAITRPHRQIRQSHFEAPGTRPERPCPRRSRPYT